MRRFWSTMACWRSSSMGANVARTRNLVSNLAASVAPVMSEPNLARFTEPMRQGSQGSRAISPHGLVERTSPRSPTLAADELKNPGSPLVSIPSTTASNTTRAWGTPAAWASKNPSSTSMLRLVDQCLEVSSVLAVMKSRMSASAQCLMDMRADRRTLPATTHLAMAWSRSMASSDESGLPAHRLMISVTPRSISTRGAGPEAVPPNPRMIEPRGRMSDTSTVTWPPPCSAVSRTSRRASTQPSRESSTLSTTAPEGGPLRSGATSSLSSCVAAHTTANSTGPAGAGSCTRYEVE